MAPDRRSQAIALTTKVQERINDRLETYADQMDQWDRGTHKMFSDLAQAILLLVDDPAAVAAHQERGHHVSEVH